MTVFAGALEDALSQGDVFPPSWDQDLGGAFGGIIVISENCEIDKPGCDTVLVASLTRDHDTDPALLGGIKGGRVWWALHLTGQGYWVSLRTIRPVLKAPLRAHLGRRALSMTDLGRMAVAAKIFSFLTMKLPPASRYIRDTRGALWDLWEVKPRVIGQVEGPCRRRARMELAGGWLYFTSGTDRRRLVPVPFGWQFLPDAELERLITAARPVGELADVVADAAEALGPPKADSRQRPA